MKDSIEYTPKAKFAILGSSLLFLFLMSCAVLSGLPGFPVAEEPVSENFGPGYSPREREERTLNAIWNLIEQNYIDYETADVDWDQLQERYNRRLEEDLSAEEFNNLMAELISELPAGSLAWQSRAERIEADLADTSSYQGIGAILAFKEELVPHAIILSVIPGSPAEQAGLKAHDSILSVDGQSVLLDEGLSVVERIRGPAGSPVTLEIQTPGQEKRLVTVKRGLLANTTGLQTGQFTETDAFYGYLLFPPIAYTNLFDDVLRGIQELTTNHHLDGLILDLRVSGSAGGWPLEEMFTAFYNGPVGEIYSRTESQPITVTGRDVFGSQSVPLVILVGQNTIGFPEILTASLQSNKRAVIIGAPTTGALETPSTFYLPDGSRAFVESTSFRLPNGEEPGRSGIKPDILIGADWDEVVPGADPVIQAAIEALGSDQ